MPCYCGCATGANKARWAVFGVALALSIIFLIVNLCVGSAYYNCINEGDSQSYCEEKYQDEYNSASVFLWLFIVCAIISSVPLYAMCCCTKKPYSIDMPQTIDLPSSPNVQPAIGILSYSQKV